MTLGGDPTLDGGDDDRRMHRVDIPNAQREQRRSRLPLLFLGGLLLFPTTATLPKTTTPVLLQWLRPEPPSTSTTAVPVLTIRPPLVPVHLGDSMTQIRSRSRARWERRIDLGRRDPIPILPIPPPYSPAASDPSLVCPPFDDSRSRVPPLPLRGCKLELALGCCFKGLDVG